MSGQQCVGYSVPAQALVGGIDWKLALYLGQTDWPSWSGLQRVSVLCSEPENVEDVSIAGLV